MFLIGSIVTFLMAAIGGMILYRYMRTTLVPEDNVAVTVDKKGFVKRVLPAGAHVLYPFERIDFRFPIKPKLVAGRAATVVTGDGILIDVNWSGVYTPRPELITEQQSQRLRNLPRADKAIARNVDISLRKLIGDYTIQALFKPVVRERIERQVSQVVANRLKPMGVVVLGLNLQVIELPGAVADALNRAKAIESLDGAIRRLDPTTREIVRGAYNLNEILRWEAYLPVPSHLALKRPETGSHLD